MKKFKLWQIAVIVFAICLFCEIFIFNFRTFGSLFYKEREISFSDLKFGPNIEVLNNNLIRVHSTIYNFSALSEESEDGKYIEIDNIDEEVKNLYLDIEKADASKPENHRVEATLWVTDEANALYFSLPKANIVKYTPRSKYINLELSGKSDKMRIVINNSNDRNIKINSIAINKTIPFEFNFIRLILLFAFIMLIYFLIPSNGYYEYKIDRKSIYQKYIIMALALANIFVFAYFNFSNPLFVDMKYKHHFQYNELTDSILQGHFYLNEEPSEELKNMENPYDYNLRKKVMADTESYSRWDSVFYNGKYYVYFGITPVLLYYLPAKVLLGTNFTATAGIIISMVIFLIATLIFMWDLILRWFKNTPFLIYLILSFFIINCSGSILYIKRPDFYSVPIAMAMMFSMLGLMFWLKATKEAGSLKKSYLFLGSLSMALIAGCRPQMLLACFFSVPILGEEVFRNRNLFSKKSVKNTIIFMLPFIVFAIFIMYYNYARFGSVFDFGANYNLTTNDMTKRGFKLSRIGLGLFMYLLQPMNITSQFPYVSEVNFFTNYMGTTIREKMFGGIMFCHIILLLNLFIFKLRKSFPKKRLFFMALTGIIFSVIIVIADTEMAGILLRYLGDYSWFMLLSADIIALVLINSLENDTLKKMFLWFIFASFMLSFIYNLAMLFSMAEHGYYLFNPELFYRVKYSFEFWL